MSVLAVGFVAAMLLGLI